MKCPSCEEVVNSVCLSFHSVSQRSQDNVVLAKDSVSQRLVDKVAKSG